MHQFDVFPHPDPAVKDGLKYFIIIQHDLHSALKTTVIAPLYPAAIFPEISKLTPIIDLYGNRYAVAVPELSHVASSFLRPAVANLGQHRDQIVRAIDLLFVGF